MNPHYSAAAFLNLLDYWRNHPVSFVQGVLGATPDPWQCDVLDTVAEEDTVAIRSCHGPGKTTLLSWVILWFPITRPFYKKKTTLKMPTTAPTFNKQVRDVLWSEVHKWWTPVADTAPALFNLFDLKQVAFELKGRPREWFAVGIASSEAINTEGYHADYLMAVFDEAKGVKPATWEAVMGMRTTQQAKFLVASTPGGTSGEFHKVFTKSDYRSTWKNLFVIHPVWLKPMLNRPEAVPDHEKSVLRASGQSVKVRYAKGGTYYSSRIREEWVRSAGEMWGTDSPVYQARVIGDFPEVEGDFLIPYRFISEAEDREIGVDGDSVWVSCDVATFGRDRTVLFVGKGGTVLHGEAITATLDTTTSSEAKAVGVGSDPKRPLYREITTTADVCIRLYRQWNAEGIIVDDTGVGGGVSSILRRKGVPHIRFVSGAAPTDKPKTQEEKDYKLYREGMESAFVNLKAQAAWVLRAAFVNGHLALGQLPRALLVPLVEQCSLVKKDQKPDGRLAVIDPDQQEEISGGLIEEGRKSPDHFHSLMMLWWATSGAARLVKPKMGAVIPKITRVGKPVGAGAGFPAGRSQRESGDKGGQAVYVDSIYR